MRTGVEPQPWDDPDEDATATINYTSGTTARPKGVQITHRNIWVNGVTFALHAGVTDRDVYLHTLPMFHANGWGMPFALTGLGVPQVVIRKIDGAEILRRVEQYGVTLMCAAPGGRRVGAGGRCELGRRGPRSRHASGSSCAGAPPPSRTIQRIEEELGWEFLQIYGLTETSPLLTVNRRRAEEDALPAEERARRLGRAGHAGARHPHRDQRHRRGARPRQHRAGGLLGAAGGDAPTRCEGGWFHTGDGGTLDDEGYLSISDRKKDVIITGGENVSSIEVEDCLFSHPAVAEVAVIGVPSREVGRDHQGARRAGAGASGHRGRPDRALQGAAGRLQGARRRSSCARRSRAPPPARCRSSSCASSTGPARSGRSTDRLSRRAPGAGRVAGMTEPPANQSDDAARRTPPPSTPRRDRRARRRRRRPDGQRRPRLRRPGRRRRGRRDRGPRAAAQGPRRAGSAERRHRGPATTSSRRPRSARPTTPQGGSIQAHGSRCVLTLRRTGWRRVTTRWLFADQLGPQFLDAPDQPALLVESRAVFRRRRFHRAKAHLLLSGLRHRALELGDQAVFLQVDTYDEALRAARTPSRCRWCSPRRYAADRFVARARLRGGRPRAAGSPPPGRTSPAGSSGRKRLLMEDFYRWQRQRFELLMDGDEPAGGRWNLDHDNREPPPKRATLGVPEPWRPGEDDIDAQVREDLDRWERDGLASFVGDDAPRWAPATRWEAHGRARALRRAPAAPTSGRPRTRCSRAGPVDGAQRAVAGDQPRPAAPAGVRARRRAGLPRRAARRSTASRATSARSSAGGSTSGRCTGTSRDDYRDRNALQADGDLPEWFRTLDADERGHGQLPVLGAARPARARLGAPHPAADGARQLRAAARLGPARRSPPGSTRSSSTATTG